MQVCITGGMFKRLLITATIAATAFTAIPDTGEAATGNTIVVIGASVTRLAGPYLRQEIGEGLVLEAFDGRSFIHPDMRGGPTIMQLFRQYLPTLEAGDWVVIEHGHGEVSLTENRRYLREVVRLLPDSVCLAVVQAHTYYGPETVAMQTWNRGMNILQREEIAAQPCSKQIQWSTTVRRVMTGPLGQPLLYDGRHPTAQGGAALAAAIAYAVGR